MTAGRGILPVPAEIAGSPNSLPVSKTSVPSRLIIDNAQLAQSKGGPKQRWGGRPRPRATPGRALALVVKSYEGQDASSICPLLHDAIIPDTFML